MATIELQYIVACQVHPALVKCSHVTRSYTLSSVTVSGQYVNVSRLVHLSVSSVQGPCLVGAAAMGFTGDPASLACDNIFEKGPSSTRGPRYMVRCMGRFRSLGHMDQIGLMSGCHEKAGEI